MHKPIKKVIHVGMRAVRRNTKSPLGTPHEPPLSVNTYKENVKAFGAHITVPSVVRYRPNQPLSCGARVWIETSAALYCDVVDSAGLRGIKEVG